MTVIKQYNTGTGQWETIRAGAQGAVGAQGVQGTQGSQGPQGNQGAQGNQGSQGTQGNQGFQGTQGAQGNAGQATASSGSAAQALVKNSGTNFDTGWASVGTAARPLLTNATYLSGSGLVLSGLVNWNGVYVANNQNGRSASSWIVTARMNWSGVAGSQQIFGRNNSSNASGGMWIRYAGSQPTIEWLNSSSVGQTSGAIGSGTVPFGQNYWYRWSLDASGANTIAKFEYANDQPTEPSSWTLWGSKTISGSTGIVFANINAAIGILAYASGHQPNATILQIIERIDNIISIDANFSTQTADALSFSATSGAGIKTNGLVLNGVAGQYATTPDSNALDVTGDIDIRAKIALTDWTPAANQAIVSKFGGGNYAYELQIASSSRPYLRWTPDGITGYTLVATANTPVIDGQVLWVRATRNATTGDANFYTSNDGLSWTQLGLTVSGTAGSIYSSTNQLWIGSRNGSLDMANGTIYRVQICNGINGTVVFDADFDAQTPEVTSFTESSSNAATVTMVGTNPIVTLDTTRYSYGIPNVQWQSVSTTALTAGTNQYTPFVITAPTVVDMARFEVTTGPSTGASSFLAAIYAADSDLQPTGSPVVDFGTVTVPQSATGIFSKQVSPVTLQPGAYLMVTRPDVAFTVRRFTGGQVYAQAGLGANPFSIIYQRGSQSGALGTVPKWNTRSASSVGAFHYVLLRWRPA